VALVTPVLGYYRSCRGQPAFGKTAVGWFLSSLSGPGLPRWKRQPAVGAAGPSGEAGPLVFKPWRLLGCQPSDSSARGMPHKSSPRQCITPIDNEIMPFSNAMVDISKISIATRSCHDVHVEI
jgi:hypothetical protein